MGHAMIIALTEYLHAQRSPIPKLLIFWTIAIALVTSAVSPAKAQRIYSIGSLNTGDSFINAFEGFRERLTELGYRERQTFGISITTREGMKSCSEPSRINLSTTKSI